MTAAKKTFVASAPSVNESLLPRKGARRRVEIPAEVLRGLNEGSLETVNLVEALAVDMIALLGAVLKQLDLKREARSMLQAAGALAEAGFLDRLRGVVALLQPVIATHRRRDELLAALRCHPSDTVRSWGASLEVELAAESLTDRLAAIRPYAADRHFGVREWAWMAVRPHLAEQIEASIALLVDWTADDDANLRRFAVEATRPRGVWCSHIAPLREQPQLGLPLLEPLRSDPHRYVQLSVANWLNDASKSQPKWVRSLCAQWKREAKSKHTDWIVHRAQRTLRKSE